MKRGDIGYTIMIITYEIGMLFGCMQFGSFLKYRFDHILHNSLGHLTNKYSSKVLSTQSPGHCC